MRSREVAHAVRRAVVDERPDRASRTAPAQRPERLVRRPRVLHCAGALDEQARYIGDESEVAGGIGEAHAPVSERAAHGGAQVRRHDERNAVELGELREHLVDLRAEQRSLGFDDEGGCRSVGSLERPSRVSSPVALARLREERKDQPGGRASVTRRSTARSVCVALGLLTATDNTPCRHVCRSRSIYVPVVPEQHDSRNTSNVSSNGRTDMRRHAPGLGSTEQSAKAQVSGIIRHEPTSATTLRKWLITRRSQVQILPPLLQEPQVRAGLQRPAPCANRPTSNGF